MELLMDLHTHTVASVHAYATVTENAKIAKERGIQILGASDHGYGMPHTTFRDHFMNLQALPTYLEGVRLLKGMEANIGDPSGRLIEENELGVLDYAIASIHLNCYEPNTGSAEEYTKAIMQTIDRYPFIRIIGHPDDSRVPLNYEQLVSYCAKKGVALEINNSSLVPGSFRKGAKENIQTYLPLCKEMGCMVVVNSDAHMATAVGDFGYARKILEEVAFPEELVVNTSWRKLEELLRITL